MPSRSRFAWLGPAFLIVLAGGIWFAPEIVARTALREAVLERIFPAEVRSRLQIGNVSAGWLNGIRADRVRLRGSADLDVFRAETIELRQPLWKLILDPTDIGTVALFDPVVTSAIRPGGSELEDALAPLLEGEGGTIPAGRVIVENGTISLTSRLGTRVTQLDAIDADFTWPRGVFDPTRLSASARVSDGEQHGQLKITFQDSEQPVDTAQDEFQLVGSTNVTARAAQFSAEDIPLAAALPAFDRLGIDGELFGTLDGRLSGAAVPATENTAAQLSVEGQIDVSRLIARGGPLAEGDRLTLSKCRLLGELTAKNGRLHFRDVALESDIAKCEIDGTQQLPNLDPQNLLRDLLANAPNQDFNWSGSIDLARTSDMLGRTLRLKESLDSGSVRFNYSSEETTNGREWSTRLNVTDLVSQNGTRWQKPFELIADASSTNGRFLIDRLVCRSAFLNADGSGSESGATIKMDCDLDRLRSELERFVSFGDNQLSGVIAADLGFERSSDKGVTTVAANGIGRNLKLVWGDLSLAEPRIGFDTKFSGYPEGQSFDTIESLTCRLEASGDELDLTLLSPLTLTDRNAPQSFQLKLSGNLARWHDRAKPWMPDDSLKVKGTGELTSELRITPTELSLIEAKLNANDFALDTPQLAIRDRRVEVETSAVIDRLTGRIRAPETVWISSSLSARIKNFEYVPEPNGARVVAVALFRGSVGRVGQWFYTASKSPPYWISGVGEGRVALEHDTSGPAMQWQMNVENPVVSRLAQTASAMPAGNWETVWSGRLAQLRGTAKLVSQVDSAELIDCSIELPEGAATFNGIINEVSGRAIADISGQVKLDTATLGPALSKIVGGEVAFVGRTNKPFFIRGPLVPPADALVSPELQAEAGLSWSSGRFYGLEAGPAELDVILKDGTASITPFEMRLSQGKLLGRGDIDLKSSQPVLSMTPGPLVERMKITRQVANGWLKYIAPLVADAAELNGSFSLALAEAQLPLNNISSGRAAGTIEVHSGTVTQGGLATSLSNTVRDVSRILSVGRIKAEPLPPLKLPPQKVVFRLANGAVTHDRFIVRAGDNLTIQTRGTVTTDGRLDIVASVPVQDRWVKDDGPSAALKGQTVSVPLRGSFSQPRVEPTFLNNLMQQVGAQKLQESIGRGLDGVGDGINRALDGLFD
ncbi:hypothetical protein [Stratiformator vulcanicus]|uniref:hypothetical protein n=1 Tax=Stratiformator vulcanicus TaxID=2527980 RepID=UPI0011A6F1DC|nr:hypothetical protein [Stratiformator vulcanicus]